MPTALYTLQLRTHYLDRHKSAGADSVSWAGGWLAWRSGRAYDYLRLELTAYSSQKLYGPEDKDGATLLATGQQSYTLIGESFVEGRFADQQAQVGRFLVNQHEVNPQDTRMSPRTFQGVAVSGKPGRFEYYLAWLSHMKTRNGTEFVEVATVAGAQYMWQGSTGANRLTGAPFDTYSAGIKLDWLTGPLTLSAFYMQTGTGAAYRTPFGSWQGYACRIITSFNRAGERVQGYDLALDLASLGAPGLALNAAATFGRSAINAASGAALSDNSEYNLTLEYRFNAPDWPRWLHPLALRARTAQLEQNLAGSRTLTSEHHLIANYAMELK